MEPVQQRRRPGRQLLRRPGGEPAAARPVRAGHRHGHAGQPEQHDRSPGCRCRPRCTTWPGTVLDDQTASNISLASQQVRTERADPEGAAPAAGPDLLRGTAARAERHPDRPQRVLAVHPARTWSTGPRRWASRRARCRQYAQPDRRCRRCRGIVGHGHRQHGSQAGPDGADLATTVTITNTSAVDGRVPAPRRHPPRHAPAARSCRATTNCSPRSGRTTTSRCSPASRRR